MEVFDDLERHIQNPLVLQSILSLMERGTMVLMYVGMSLCCLCGFIWYEGCF